MESNEKDAIITEKNGDNMNIEQPTQMKPDLQTSNDHTISKENKSRKDSLVSRERSSTKEKKKSKKPKRKKSNSRSSSKGKKKKYKRSRSRSKSKDRRKKSKKHRKSKKYRERSRSKHSSKSSRKRSSINKILEKDNQENNKVSDNVQEKKRSRTRSPPRFPIQKNRFANYLDFDGGKPRYFWDGFQWVARTNSVANIDPNILNQTRKMRRVQISNLPLYMGLNEKDITQIVSKFLIDNFLNDEGNIRPVLSSSLNHQGNFAIMEISSVEEANRLIKIESIKIFNNNCKITRVGESMYGPTMNLQTLVTNAQTSAQAQAAALVALQSLQSKEGSNTSFTLGKTCITPPSSVIKVSNLFQMENVKTMTDENYEDIQNDIFALFGEHGTVINGFIVKPHQAAIGAEVGCMFLEFFDKETAEKTMNTLVGKKYNNKELKMIFIPEDVFNKNFKGLQDLK